MKKHPQTKKVEAFYADPEVMKGLNATHPWSECNRIVEEELGLVLKFFFCVCVCLFCGALFF